MIKNKWMYILLGLSYVVASGVFFVKHDTGLLFVVLVGTCVAILSALIDIGDKLKK